MINHKCSTFFHISKTYQSHSKRKLLLSLMISIMIMNIWKGCELQMKTLVAYFSRKGNNYVNGKIMNLSTGNTELVAKKIAVITNGDLFEIKPIHPYSKDYQECTKEAKQELQANARPALIGELPDISKYDIMYLGYPNWWGTMPMAVGTFLESIDFAGKTIRPFCTHEGSGMGHSEEDIKNSCPSAILKKGVPIRGGSVKDCDKTIENWIMDNFGF